MADKETDPRIWVVFTDGDQVLLTKRSEICNNPGTWGFPGGHLDDGEEPFEGAVREVQEEMKCWIQSSKLKFLACGTVKKKDCIWFSYPISKLGLFAREMVLTEEISGYTIANKNDLNNTRSILLPEGKLDLHYSAHGLWNHNPRFPKA